MGNYDINELNEIAELGANDENGANARSVTTITIPWSIAMTVSLVSMVTSSVEPKTCC